jgi:hypothetical protein
MRAVSFVVLTTSIVSVYCFVMGRALPPLRNEPASFLLLPVSAICGIVASVLYPVLLRQRSRASRIRWMYMGFLIVLVLYGLYLWRFIPDGTAGLIVLALVAGHFYGVPALLTVLGATTVLDRILFPAPSADRPDPGVGD